MLQVLHKVTLQEIIKKQQNYENENKTVF